jgi:hypothetical protein
MFISAALIMQHVLVLTIHMPIINVDLPYHEQERERERIADNSSLSAATYDDDDAHLHTIIMATKMHLSLVI